MTDYAKIIDEMKDEICKYCPWTKGYIGRHADSLCEGRFCEESVDNYLEQTEDNTNN